MTDEALHGKVAIITGANTGIGKATAMALAHRGAEVFLACRSPTKANLVVEEIRHTVDDHSAKVEVLQLDLGSLAQVRVAAEAFLALGRPLHLLINNAGVAGPRGLTADGFEVAFGVNHLGHFLFTQLLLDRLGESPEARIVNVASAAHYQAKVLDWDAVREPTKTVTGLLEYERSKLANVLHAKELARRLEHTGITTYSLHPGVVASDVWRRVPAPFRWLMKQFMISNEDGAETTLHCATAQNIASHSGRYYDGCQEKQPSALALDASLARELWERSEAWTK